MPSEERELLPLGTGFDVVRRGYDRGQVEEHLDRVEADLRILTADRDAAVGQASELARALDRTRAHVEELRSQIDRLAAPPDTMEGLSERLQRMLRLAQDEAREMRGAAENAARRTRHEADEYSRAVRADADEYARATRADADERARVTTDEAAEQARRTVGEAEQQARGTIDEARRGAHDMLARAEAEADEVRVRYDAGVADNERRRAEMEDAHRTLMEGARAEAARIVREAEQERGRLDEQSAARRAQVEHDFDVAMASRRAESMRVLARSEAEARERADKQLREAGEEARRRVREADSEVADIRRLRARVSNQLATLRESLADLPGLDAFPDEQGADGRPVLHADAPEHRRDDLVAPSSTDGGPRPNGGPARTPAGATRADGPPQQPRADGPPQQPRADGPRADGPPQQRSAAAGRATTSAPS